MDGREYFFIDQASFDQMVADDLLLEHASYVSHSYGTPRQYVEARLQEGMNVILDIEVQGARQVVAKMPTAVTVFILPPSMAELRRRLEGRGTDSPEVIDARISRARQEIQEADFYQYMIVNEDFHSAAKQLEAIITAEHCRFDAASVSRLACSDC